MKNIDRLFLIELPITRKNFNTTKAAKYRGKIELISNWKGVVYDWKITLTDISIDIYSTPAHFKKGPVIFKYRETLFKELGLEQIPRPTKSSKKLIILNEEQIKLVNNFFNNREKYNSTLKNIVGIMKGNNPGGEFSKPNSAEMILIGNKNMQNFIILIDDLCRNKKECFEMYKYLSDKITLEQYLKLDETLSNLYTLLQENKNDIKMLKRYKAKIKEHVKLYNDKFRDVEKIAFQKRNEYSKNIENIYKGKSLAFGFKGDDNTLYQRCHIYEYSTIRDKAVELLYQYNNIKNVEEILNKIADPENFIPLPESFHRVFDKKLFSYDDKGNLFWIDESIKNMLIPDINKFLKIEDFFMTDKRKEYFNIRNKLVEEKMKKNES